MANEKCQLLCSKVVYVFLGFKRLEILQQAITYVHSYQWETPFPICSPKLYFTGSQARVLFNLVSHFYDHCGLKSLYLYLFQGFLRCFQILSSSKSTEYTHIQFWHVAQQNKQNTYLLRNSGENGTVYKREFK